MRLMQPGLVIVAVAVFEVVLSQPPRFRTAV
jgi:hypothetical protein